MDQVRYKRGDASPDKPGLVFFSRRAGKERWVTPEYLVRYRNETKVSQREAYRNHPDFRKRSLGYFATYREKNRATLNLKARKSAAKNRELMKERYKRWSQTPHGREVLRKRDARYRSTPNGRIINSMRGRIHDALTAQNLRKNQSLETLLGCPLALFKTHLQSMFQPGFSWNNYGTLWEIDHRTPLRSYNLADKKQLHAAFNWSNCQPMLIAENRAKSDRLDGHLFRARELA